MPKIVHAQFNILSSLLPSLYSLCTILRIVVGSLKTVEGTLAGIISQLLFVWTLQYTGK